ncbi:hypothetical protein L6250_03805 [Candidatus Parcubacteria bacterium]|nr:hypothetical protein [Patescibacteria group bacterium]MCG2688726.1 hypothetical protein [Candidatus Parcubacteria bacterium]
MKEKLAIARATSANLSLILAGLALSIPAIFTSPQWLIGIIVNALLFVAAIKLDSKNHWPVIILPSLGALLHGVIFGPLTFFLIYFIPFIWLGNYLLVRLASFKWPFVWRVIIASVLKSTILFLTAFFYVNISLVPKIFLSSMGLMQLVTALIGGLIAYFVIDLI